MPINNLTDEKTRQDIGLVLPTAARVFKGAKKTGNKPGEDLDTFRFEWHPAWSVARHHFENLQWVQEVAGKVDRLPIQFVHPTVESNFPTWYELWRGNNTLNRRCDGCTVARHLTDGGAYSEEPRPCMCDPAKRDSNDYRDRRGQCTAVGRLFFTIPQVSEKTGVSLQFILTTHSVTELKEISAVLQAVYDRAGTLQNIPFMLLREPREMTFEQNGQQNKKTYSIVRLVPPLKILALNTQVPGSNVPALESEFETDEPAALPDDTDDEPPANATDWADTPQEWLDDTDNEPPPAPDKQAPVTLEKIEGLLAKHFGEDVTLERLREALQKAGIEVPSDAEKWMGGWRDRNVSLKDISFELCQNVAQAEMRPRITGIMPLGNDPFYTVFFMLTPIRFYGAGGIFEGKMSNFDLPAEQIEDVTAAIRDDEPVSFEARFGWDNSEMPTVSIREKVRDDGTVYFVVEELFL